MKKQTKKGDVLKRNDFTSFGKHENGKRFGYLILKKEGRNYKQHKFAFAKKIKEDGEEKYLLMTDFDLSNIGGTNCDMVKVSKEIDDKFYKTFINKELNYITDFKFTFATVFINNISKVKIEEKVFFINKKGEVLNPNENKKEIEEFKKKLKERIANIEKERERNRPEKQTFMEMYRDA